MPVFRHLERLTSALAGALTVDDTARIVLTELLAVEDVGRAGMALAQGAGRELRFTASDGVGLDPHGHRWCTIDALADVPLAQAVRSGQPVYLSDEQELSRCYPQLTEQQLRMGIRSLAAIPLVLDGECVGGLLVSWSVAQEHGPAQRGFLAAFAAQVAHAVRRGLAFEAQLTTSEELLRSLLPHSLPDVECLSFGAHYRPAEGGRAVGRDVGGDWYDVMPLPDGQVVVSLGDVMGKGIQAAVVMGEVRAATRAYALLDPDPSRVLERLDRLLVAGPAAEQLVTMVFGVIDASRSEMRLAVAGHPPPLVVPAAAPARLVEVPGGAALGLSAGPWPSTTIPLDTGDGVLLYSDGLVESRERDLFSGIERLRETVTSLQDRQRTPREMCASLAGSLRSQNYDDVAILAVAASGPRQTAVRTFPPDTRAAGLARRFLAEVLAGWSVSDEVADRAELCVSELVTNAVIHTGTQPTVRVSNDGSHLLVAVHDEGSHQRIRPTEPPAPEEVSGRGLALVQALVSSWNVEHTTGGTSVWCELALEASDEDFDTLLAWDDVAL